jgi:adenosylmethionine-8-amino-7-oxononanoate aminotransferase
LSSSLQNRDRDIIWHPYTQMKDALPFIPMVRGEGSYLFDEAGNKYIDAVSSWWTNIHGHGDPDIAEAIYAQAQKLEQVIFAGFTHEPAVQLAEMLLQRIPFHKRVFYSDNGSTAVEVAIKMALQFYWNKGEIRSKVIAFKDAYHGDTFGAMSVSARGVFTAPFQNLLFDVEFISTPTPGNEQLAIDEMNALIERYGKSNIAAFIFEPLVLGSSGMLMYSEKVLDDLMEICKANNIITIADEVMTGFGRTGKFLATDYCQNKPDIICLSKGITGGFLPFAVTTCTAEIYDAFLSNDKAKMFFHGHSYTANPLGCAAGIASLKLFDTDNTFDKIAQIEKWHAAFESEIKGNAFVSEVRHRGTIIAIELKTDNGGYLDNIRDRAYRFFIERKIILRPLGHIIYILPPYCTSEKDMQLVYSAIRDFLGSLTGSVSVNNKSGQ